MHTLLKRCTKLCSMAESKFQIVRPTGMTGNNLYGFISSFKFSSSTASDFTESLLLSAKVLMKL